MPLTPTTTDLHKLAGQLAKMDCKGSKRGYDQSVIGAQTTLANLGRVLRRCSAERAFAIVAALLERGGRK